MNVDVSRNLTWINITTLGFALFSFFFLPLWQAECWLGGLEYAMRSTVRQEISEAVAAYEDKPRDQWLFDYPAQVCVFWCGGNTGSVQHPDQNSGCVYVYVLGGTDW